VDKDLKAEISVLDLTGGRSIDELTAKIASQSISTAGTPTTLKIGEFACVRPISKPLCRLLCFPFVGAPGAVFQSWLNFLDPRVELWTPEPYNLGDWDQILDKYVKNIELILKGDTSTPLVIYGHSLGAFIAYELALRLQNSPTGKYPPVKALVVGACGSPALPGTLDHLGTEFTDEDVIRMAKNEEEKFLNHLVRLRIVENTALGKNVLLPQVLLGRRHTRWYSQLSRSEESGSFKGTLVGLHGTKDAIMPNPEVVHAWQKHSPQFQYQELEGGHSFMIELAADVVKIVNHTILG